MAKASRRESATPSGAGWRALRLYHESSSRNRTTNQDTEAEQIVKAVKDKGGIVQYKLYDDEGHGIAKLKNRLDLYPQVADFLDKYMK